jgi:hypothetical protein
MAKPTDPKKAEPNHEPQEAAVQIRLPGFLIDEPVGLGDVLKRATSAVGVPPCGGCQSRAAKLNRWIAFTRGSKQP